MPTVAPHFTCEKSLPFITELIYIKSLRVQYKTACLILRVRESGKCEGKLTKKLVFGANNLVE